MELLIVLGQTPKSRGKNKYFSFTCLFIHLQAGFDIAPGDHPIVPVMLADSAGPKDVTKITGAWYICHRLFLPCCRKRKSSNTYSNFSSTYNRRFRQSHFSFCRNT
jgi:hypothetical protein